LGKNPVEYQKNYLYKKNKEAKKDKKAKDKKDKKKKKKIIKGFLSGKRNYTVDEYNSLSTDEKC